MFLLFISFYRKVFICIILNYFKMGTKFNLKRYNEEEPYNTAKASQLEKKLLEGVRVRQSTSRSLKEHKILLNEENNLRDRIQKLNPLGHLEGSYSSGWLYGAKNHNRLGYERKLPLEKTDAELIDIIDARIGANWEFLQIRTEELRGGAVQNYVLAFEYSGKEDYNTLRNRMSKPFKGIEYDIDFVKKLGLMDMGNNLPKKLNKDYRLIGLRLCPGIEWGGQGEAGCFTNYRFLFVELELEDMKIEQARLLKVVTDLEIQTSIARQIYLKYKK